ncbi:MAG: hypothetical protein ACI3W5_10465 [Faecousia sp.]
MKAKKVITAIILVLEVALILMGLYIVIQSGADHTGVNGSGVTRASTSIKFGGDFYTTSAQYSGLAANTLIDLYKMVSLGMGFFFVFVGGISACVTVLKVDSMKAFGKEKPAETETTNFSIPQ